MTYQDGLEGKKEGMARVARHANPAWLRGADHCARLTVRDRYEFTADDVHDLMQILYPGVKTHDDRAMGPVIGKLAKEGLIVKSDRLPVPSRRGKRHAGPCTVWRRGPMS
jgi:hypothetical protein